MKRTAKLTGIAVAAVLVGIQFFPVDRSNPPVESEVAAPSQVIEVLRQSCYDCHSSETVWPWYSRIAPVSWLIASDVNEGREHLNFSAWNRLNAEERVEARHEIWEEVSEGKMPLWFYLPLHPDARLSESERSILRAWSQAVAGGGAEEDEH